MYRLRTVNVRITAPIPNRQINMHLILLSLLYRAYVRCAVVTSQEKLLDYNNEL